MDRGAHAAGAEIRACRQGVALFRHDGADGARAAQRAVRRHVDEVHFDLGVVGQVEAIGGGFRQIDDAALGVRPAIVDAHHQLTPVGQVGDTNIARDRQGRVRRGQAVGIELLAQRGGVAVGFFAIPGRQAGLREVLRIFYDAVSIAINLIILHVIRVIGFILRLDATDFHHRAVVRLLWRLLFRGRGGTGGEQHRRDADPKPFLTHYSPLINF